MKIYISWYFHAIFYLNFSFFVVAYSAAVELLVLCSLPGIVLNTVCTRSPQVNSIDRFGSKVECSNVVIYQNIKLAFKTEMREIKEASFSIKKKVQVRSH